MFFYRILSVLAFPFLELWLFYRAFKKKEDKKRLKERFGHATIAKPEGEIIWMHAVSVGETNSAMILADELLQKNKNAKILFTTTTLTSASIIAKKESEYKGRLVHQFLPIDSYYCAKSFLTFWQPKMAIFVESEIWPNLISLTKKMQIKRFLVNARMSDSSFKKWKIAKIFFFRIFRKFDAIFAQTKIDQERLQYLSGKKTYYFGNLKSQANAPKIDQAKLKILQKEIGQRKLFIAASTHKGEEEIILKAHKKLQKKFSDLLTIIIIRHPNRADEVAEILDVEFVQRSKEEKIKKSTQIYLADTLGEIGIFYSLADFVFIAGSLKEIGGHNPFEAIKLKTAVISGPYIFNFSEIYEELVKQKACIIAKDENEIFDNVQKLFKDDKLVKDLVKKSEKVILNSDNISSNIIDEIIKI